MADDDPFGVFGDEEEDDSVVQDEESSRVVNALVDQANARMSKKDESQPIISDNLVQEEVVSSMLAV